MNASEYARHRKAKGLRGATHVAVLKAIEAGRLTSAAARREGDLWVIDPKIADREWSANTDPEACNPSGKGAEAEAAKKPSRPAQSPMDSGLGNVPPLHVSKAVRAAYMARLAGVELDKNLGERVLKSEVRKEAFELGRRIRENLLNLPDRFAFELAAITDPAELHHRLTDALIEILQELTQEGA
jgi:hypothetical protein